jgi:hypothetical protein
MKWIAIAITVNKKTILFPCGGLINRRTKMNNIKFTQEDAEYLAEWFNFVNSKSFGILSEEFKNEVIKADIIRGNLTQLMYENSNWRIKRKYRKGKYSKATIEYVSNEENQNETI